MKRTHFIAIALVTSLCAGVADAQTNKGEPAADTAKKNIFPELDRLNSDNTLLAARIANATLKRKLQKLEAGEDPEAPTATPGITGTTLSPQPLQPAGFGSSGAPRRAEVQIVTSSLKVNEGKPTALIQLPNGSIMSAAVGTKVPGVGTITAVSIREVLASDKGQVTAIPFVGEGDGGH